MIKMKKKEEEPLWYKIAKLIIEAIGATAALITAIKIK